MKKFSTFFISYLLTFGLMAFAVKAGKPTQVPITMASMGVVPFEVDLDFNISLEELDPFGHEAFLDKIGHAESGNNYTRVNRLGYLGRYQFGRQALKQVDLNIPKAEFLNSPELQETAMQRLLEYNYSVLESFIEKYEGTVLHGVLVTQSGVLAAAHLGGPSSVRKWFRYGRDFKDANGTSITKYMKTFKGYDLVIN